MTTRAIERLAHRDLLSRVLDTQYLPELVPKLEPEILHQLITACGLEDCAPIVTLATPDQLMRVFDLDLWRSERPGLADRFDTERFGVWLDVLTEAGGAAAAQMLVGMDFDFVTAAIHRCVLVLNRELVAGRDSGDADVNDDAAGLWDAATARAIENGLSVEISGYTIVGRRSDSWDALLSLLVSLDADHHDFFMRVMNRCWRIVMDHIDDNGRLYDVSSADQQVMSDAAFEREQRREAQGYVTPAQAVAFLESARRTPLDGAVAPDRDHSTRSYFRDIARQAPTRADQLVAPETGEAPSRRDDEDGARVAGFISALRDAGVVQTTTPSLLTDGSTRDRPRLSLITRMMQVVQEQDVTTYSTRLEELGYLANVLMAGCSIDARRFTVSDASQASFAICNLGLENWPRHWLSPSHPSRAESSDGGEALPETFLFGQDLPAVFRVGWTIVHEQVCMYTAHRLVAILSEVTCRDDIVQHQIAALIRRLTWDLQSGAPWRSRDSLDVLAVLDPPSWSILLRLLDECPRVPKIEESHTHRRAPLRVTSEFEFISDNGQVAWARAYVESLPTRLRE